MTAALASGPKQGTPAFLQRVHRAQHQRVVRGHHGEVHPGFSAAKRTMPSISLAPTGHAHGVRRNAAVARQGVNFLYLRILFQRFYHALLHGVLSAAAASPPSLILPIT
jgi:hypothetical protein